MHAAAGRRPAACSVHCLSVDGRRILDCDVPYHNHRVYVRLRGHTTHDCFSLSILSLTCEAALDATVPGVETGKTNDDTVGDAATTNVAVAVKPHIMSTSKWTKKKLQVAPASRVDPPPLLSVATSRCLWRRFARRRLGCLVGHFSCFCLSVRSMRAAGWKGWALLGLGVCGEAFVSG